jgi:endo-1,4-beta-xylanase
MKDSKMKQHDGFMLPGKENAGSGKNRMIRLSFLACWLGLFSVRAFSQPLAEGRDKFLGCSMGSVISRYFERYFNQVTPGNDGKWGSVEYTQGQYSWTTFDKIYAFAVKRNFPFKEHTLIWGNQQPGWIAYLDTASQRAAVEKWMRAIGERCPDMALVDVVNEPIHAPPPYKDALGGDGKTGWNWVIRCFELARRYCPPGAKLILNEYSVLHNNSATTGYLDIINALKNRGLIDGIGIQGHYFEFRSHTDATVGYYVNDINTIKANLDRLAQTGIPVYISEFDIDEKNDANQLAQYKIYFPIFWEHPGVKGITFWGAIQGDVWDAHPDTYLLKSDGTERPALQWLRTYISSSAVSDAEALAPDGFALKQNYPNPFHPVTCIRFSTAVEGPVELRVYDLTGREIGTLVSGRMGAGEHAVQFDAGGLNSGVYVYRIRAGDFQAARKMIIAK